MGGADDRGGGGSRSPLPAQRIVLAMLRAGDNEAALRAAVEDGRELHEARRWGVASCPRMFLDNARLKCPPAAGHAEGLVRAWVRRWGDKQPHPVA